MDKRDAPESNPNGQNILPSHLPELLDTAYQLFDGNSDMMEYCNRHRVESLSVLTVYSDEIADGIAEFLKPKIRGKVVVEIGAGIGLLACHLARYAKHVYAIEANPVWASCFAVALMKRKPMNCSYILGSASEMKGLIRADIALYCTHSGGESMRKAAEMFSGIVIDVYRDLLGGKIHPAAQRVREMSMTNSVPYA